MHLKYAKSIFNIHWKLHNEGVRCTFMRREFHIREMVPCDVFLFICTPSFCSGIQASLTQGPQTGLPSRHWSDPDLLSISEGVAAAGTFKQCTSLPASADKANSSPIRPFFRWTYSVLLVVVGSQLRGKGSWEVRVESEAVHLMLPSMTFWFQRGVWSLTFQTLQ